jgi:Protein of unknown function (DUF2442)
MMNIYPKIKTVRPLPNKQLLVMFQNDVQKIYDCTRLLEDDLFDLLHHDAFFNAVQVDAGGYGISWNDELDLSEAELWIHGRFLETINQFKPISTP